MFDEATLKKCTISQEEIARVAKLSKHHIMAVHEGVGIHQCMLNGHIYVLRAMTLAEARELLKVP